MKYLSNVLSNIPKKLQIQESSISTPSLQKILKLFGYLNGKNHMYICCIKNSLLRIDFHKYNINNTYFIMCIISTNSNTLVNAILWDVHESKYHIINNNSIYSQLKTHNLSYDIKGMDIIIKNLTSNKYRVVMKY